MNFKDWSSIINIPIVIAFIHSNVNKTGFVVPNYTFPFFFCSKYFNAIFKPVHIELVHLFLCLRMNCGILENGICQQTKDTWPKVMTM